MVEERKDVRDPDPGATHRAAFMKGWTDGEKGVLYQAVTNSKTHTNMGNLFGWIYGTQDKDFKMETWYRYRVNSIVEK
jgi:hypothetical protein